MTQPRRGLGRGLDALFGGGPSVREPEPVVEETPEEEAVAEPPPAMVLPVPVPEPPREDAPPPVQVRRMGPELLDIDLIAPNPEQPRTHFEPEQLRELAESIAEHGIIQPLIVTRDESNGYRLIAGERRLQAARLAGLQTVPVVMREVADSELLELALIENIQRADLNAIEEAMAYRRLMEEYGLTQEETARRVGKSRVTVANSLRLLNLDQEIRRSLVAGEITEGHARALLGVADPRARIATWRDVVKRRLSVRDTEAAVRRVAAAATAVEHGADTGSQDSAVKARRDSELADIEARLRRALSTKVTIVPQKRGARITIECYSAEEFEHVIETLLGEQEEADA